MARCSTGQLFRPWTVAALPAWAAVRSGPVPALIVGPVVHRGRRAALTRVGGDDELPPEIDVLLSEEHGGRAAVDGQVHARFYVHVGEIVGVEHLLVPFHHLIRHGELHIAAAVGAPDLPAVDVEPHLARTITEQSVEA